MRGDYVAFGTYGLKAMEPGWISARQIESSRITIARITRKLGSFPQANRQDTRCKRI